MTNLSFGRYTVEISNEDKVFFPDAGITKGDVIAYYRKIADTILPHLKDRTLSMQRFPDGITSDGFYQKEAGDYFPDWIKTVKIKKKNGSNNQVVIENAATLVYLANQGMITPHIWLSRIDKPDHPDRLVFDLDPPGDDFGPVRTAAKELVAFLDDLGLPAFVQTTGSTGLHLAVPLDRSENFDSVRDFAQKIASILADRHPDDLTTEVRKQKRRGRVFLDTARNAYGQTFVAPYSLRPRADAPVAAPITFKELDRSSLSPRKYTIRNIFHRLGAVHDPWRNINRRAVSLAKARRALDRAAGK